MSYAVESRVPFLIPEIVDFAFSLPERFLISDRGETKSVFRAAMRGLVPNAILDRRDKIGFITPQDDWLREAEGRLSSLVNKDAARSIPVLNHAVLSRSVADLVDGDGPMPQHIWRVANLTRWSEIFDVSFDGG